MEVVEYREDLREPAIGLLSRGKKPEYADLKRKLWDWQFLHNPCADSASPFILFMENGKLVGFNGSMPVTTRYNGERVDALWSCDTILDPAYHGQGHGKALLHAIQIKRPVVMGLGISDMASPVLLRHGWQPNAEAETYYFCGKVESARDAVRMAAQLGRSWVGLARSPRTDALRTRITDAVDIPEEVDRLWERVEAGYAKVVVRDLRYLRWKYGSHPLASYEAVIVEENGELAAIGIFRRARRRSRLVDYVGPTRGIHLKHAVLRSFMQSCTGCHRLECLTTDDEFKTCLQRLGYQRYRTRPRFYVLSNLAADPDPAGNWFVMAGDSDQDMLYAAGLA